MHGVSELKIDKDCFVDHDWMENYINVIKKICRYFGLAVKVIRVCESTLKGLHFYITITPPVVAAFANQLQWLLGDDSRRVDFNRARIESELEEWNKLFEVSGRQLKTIYRAPD